MKAAELELKDERVEPRATVLCPVVAIGASAGGLEAFSGLLRALPRDPGVALVFIPHLDPTHESAMVELLSRTTRLPVRQAQDGMAVVCNTVYVLPPNSELAISEGVLRLTRRDTSRSQHMPIDTFMRSLAEDQESNGIGVILSGTANDGTRGLGDIKAEAESPSPRIQKARNMTGCQAVR